MYYMEVISVKFKPEVLRRIDKQIETHNFTSRTEFIREAVRDKMAALTREEAIEKFMAMRGTLKPRTTKSDEEIREEVSKEMLAEYKKKFNLSPLEASKK